jgi:FtsP/CotA-like multicopper oxidase with cupredoxin domain
MQNVAYYELTASEFDWSISANKTIKAWGLNNTVPGPVLKAKKGDLLVVKLINQLPEPTMIHWHGIRLPASMDGTGEVQKPVLPGESFEYRFIVPDAGTFWYHSHHNETVQMERGMYGALIVEEETALITDGERIFMIDDMKLTASNQFKKGNAISRWAERHDGRQGDTLLINGKENTLISMAAGQTEKWRFINSSSARYFNLSFGGRPFRVIATDGGLIDTAQEQTELLITPGERYDILMGPFAAGETFGIDSLAYNRTTFLKAKQQRFASVEVTEAKASIAVIPTRLNNIPPIAGPHAPVNRQVKLSVGPSLKRGIDFLVNNEMHVNDKPVHVDELQVWEVSNASLMDHPFHLHGFFFQVLEINGKAPAYLSWKDTVNIPPKSKVKIAWIPDDRPGIWMYHCHIIEHHAAGMMANFQVLGKGEQAMELSHHCHA